MGTLQKVLVPSFTHSSLSCHISYDSDFLSSSFQNDTVFYGRFPKFRLFYGIYVTRDDGNVRLVEERQESLDAIIEFVVAERLKICNDKEKQMTHFKLRPVPLLSLSEVLSARTNPTLVNTCQMTLITCNANINIFIINIISFNLVKLVIASRVFVFAVCFIFADSLQCHI